LCRGEIARAIAARLGVSRNSVFNAAGAGSIRTCELGDAYCSAAKPLLLAIHDGYGGIYVFAAEVVADLLRILIKLNR
jgi:hypothetical protein